MTANRTALMLLLPLVSCAKPPAEVHPEPSELAPAHVAAPPAAAPGAPDVAAAPAPAEETPPPLFRAERPVTLAALPWDGDEPAVLRADTRLGADPPDAQGALAALGDAPTPAAALVRARAQRILGALDDASASLDVAATDDVLSHLVALERGLLAAARGDAAAAAAALLPLLSSTRSVQLRAVGPLTDALAAAQPEVFLAKVPDIEAALPDDLSARSLLLAKQADVLEQLGRADEARAVRLKRYLEEPVAPETPTAPPAGTSPTAAQLLARAEVLLNAHRNERVIEAMSAVPEAGLSKEEVCRRRFGLGLAHRKLHHYTSAEELLMGVVKDCADEDLARRALYLATKVISIKSGLRAIEPIETFAKRFAGDSMVDDVLFWAGDLYQRRNRIPEAERYYKRIQALPDKGDHCADARWRMAWMSYQAGRADEAKTRLERTFEDDGCSPARFDRARARYWLGRLAEKKDDAAGARAQYEQAVDLTPLGYYGQLALKRLVAAGPEAEAKWAQKLAAPAGDAVPPMCPGRLADDATFLRGVRLLLRGLGSDAAEELLAVAPPEQQVVATSHAVNQGIEPQAAEAVHTDLGADCGDDDPGMLIALLLDRAGAHRDAHWRLRTELADALEHFPTPRQIGLFKAAYPLAYRDEIAAAEKESDLPSLFLQALSREESAFDPEIVSWAGAYGLTQLLLRTGQRAGELLKPPVEVKTPEELLDPALNARLGGAFMASLMRRYKQNPALSLVAYNASERFANTLWKRFRHDDFDRFAEEITIRETRGYVKRVLKTYGIYRWLYGDGPPELPIAMRLPELD